MDPEIDYSKITTLAGELESHQQELLYEILSDHGYSKHLEECLEDKIAEKYPTTTLERTLRDHLRIPTSRAKRMVVKCFKNLEPYSIDTIAAKAVIDAAGDGTSED